MSFAHRLLIAACCMGMLAGIVLVSQQASACSRVLYTSKDGNYVLVGRNMDWTEDLRSNLWVFPRGIKRDGLAARPTTSRFGKSLPDDFPCPTHTSARACPRRCSTDSRTDRALFPERRHAFAKILGARRQLERERLVAQLLFERRITACVQQPLRESERDRRSPHPRQVRPHR